MPIIKYHVETRIPGAARCGSNQGHVQTEKWFREIKTDSYRAVIRNASCKACEAHLEDVGIWPKKR